MFTVDVFEQVETRWGIEDDFVGVTPYPTKDSALHASDLYHGAIVVYDLVYPDGRHSGWIPLAPGVDGERDGC